MNLEVFFKSLEIMGAGMAGIFFVICVFYGLIVLLGKVFPANRE